MNFWFYLYFRTEGVINLWFEFILVLNYRLSWLDCYLVVYNWWLSLGYCYLWVEDWLELVVNVYSRLVHLYYLWRRCSDDWVEIYGWLTQNGLRIDIDRWVWHLDIDVLSPFQSLNNGLHSLDYSNVSYSVISVVIRILKIRLRFRFSQALDPRHDHLNIFPHHRNLLA